MALFVHRRPRRRRRFLLCYGGLVAIIFATVVSSIDPEQASSNHHDDDDNHPRDYRGRRNNENGGTQGSRDSNRREPSTLQKDLSRLVDRVEVLRKRTRDNDGGVLWYGSDDPEEYAHPRGPKLRAPPSPPRDIYTKGGCTNSQRVINLLRGDGNCNNNNNSSSSSSSSSKKSHKQKSSKKGKGKKSSKKGKGKKDGSHKKVKGKGKKKFNKWKGKKQVPGPGKKGSGMGYTPPWDWRRKRARTPAPKMETEAPTGTPSSVPTSGPTISLAPTGVPSLTPTLAPSTTPSLVPSSFPSEIPTFAPSSAPTNAPTKAPVPPTQPPTRSPTQHPSPSPTLSPTRSPTRSPTQIPTPSPTLSPTRSPTRGPSASPTGSPTATPSRSPTAAPTEVPIPSPTVQPTTTPPTPQPGCTPTIGLGDCLRTAEQLSAILPFATKGSVIGVCGGSDPIEINERLRITNGGVTFCCADAVKPCILQSTGRDMILETRGQINLIDLTFRNGTNPGGDGGNLYAQGFGDPHRITRCTFEGGQSGSGGNVFFSSTGKIEISGSSFIDGSASTTGGGMAIERVTEIVIDGTNAVNGPTVFRGNRAGTEGGAIFTKREDVSNEIGQQINIEGAVFVDNSANIGGALAISELGSMPSLTVLETEFSDNSASDTGGAGAFLETIEGITVTFEGNTGSGNTAAAGDCADFRIFDAPAGNEVCLPVSESYP